MGYIMCSQTHRLLGHAGFQASVGERNSSKLVGTEYFEAKGLRAMSLGKAYWQ